MAQQQPNFNQQQYPGAYRGGPAWGMPPQRGYGYGYGYGYPASAGMDPRMMAPGAGTDPKQLQAVLNALQNPDAGDQVQIKNPFEDNPFFPKPQHMAYGAGAGIGIAAVLEKLFQSKGAGREYDLILRAAKRFDSLPGIRHASQFMEDKIVNKILARSNGLSRKQRWYYQHLMNRLPPQAAERYVVKDIVNTLRGHVDDDLLKKLTNERLLKGAEPAKAVLQTLEGGEKFLIGKNLAKLPKNIPAEALKELQAATTFKEAHRVISRHGLKKEAAEFLKAVDKTTAKRLFGLRSRLKGEISLHFEPYKMQHGLSKTLRQKNVGPIGRAIVTVSNTVRRIFSGSTLMMGRKVAEPAAEKSFLRSIPIIGPAMMGALIVGQSFTQASKAEKGEKLSSFMHDFIGFGIGNFVGWEIGRQILKKSQVFTRLFTKLGLGKLATKTLFRVPVLGFGVTITGFLVEMTAIFGFGGVFQKVGEWFSHKIFGKPTHITKEELEKKGIQQAMAPQEGQPLRRSSRFSDLDMNLDHKDYRALKAQQQAPTRAEPLPTPEFTVSPEEIMKSPAAAEFSEFERSLGL